MVGHAVKTARQVGWSTIKNGELLALAAKEFQVFVTVDRNLSFRRIFRPSSSCVRDRIDSRIFSVPRISRHCHWPKRASASGRDIRETTCLAGGVVGMSPPRRPPLLAIHREGPLIFRSIGSTCPLPARARKRAAHTTRATPRSGNRPRKRSGCRISARISRLSAIRGPGRLK
ncbi:MAG: hypothetical protein ACREXX_16665 [Gammaproteobacteria bacterium]